MPTKAGSTIVRNVSGKTMYFAFLGANGLELANGADATLTGSIYQRYINDPIMTGAINYALDNNLIEILKSPDTFGYDVSLSQARKLNFASGTVSSSAPDYGSYTGPAPS